MGTSLPDRATYFHIYNIDYLIEHDHIRFANTDSSSVHMCEFDSGPFDESDELNEFLNSMYEGDGN